MPIKIKNWKLAILAVVFICFFTALGNWQLQRAKQKKILLKSFAERTLHVPFSAAEINQNQDWRFYRTELTGTFDNQHTFLLDNKIVAGKVGYEVYTPFTANHLNQTILVDRGFVPMTGATRKELPDIKSITGTVTINGMLNQAPTYVAFGTINEAPQISWPLRVEFINLKELAKFSGYPFYNYVLNINPKDNAAYAMQWEIVTMGPERHMGYAVQWFALALTLLILFVALNWDRK